ncbi:hypothetical protein BASA62_005598 [Batrachochytrium salamandrivorans]|nr:hypothetical protein BASA62_005598 [Batrachochytrium salamandrivorans]
MPSRRERNLIGKRGNKTDYCGILCRFCPDGFLASEQAPQFYFPTTSSWSYSSTYGGFLSVPLEWISPPFPPPACQLSHDLMCNAVLIRAPLQMRCHRKSYPLVHQFHVWECMRFLTPRKSRSLGDQSQEPNGIIALRRPAEPGNSFAQIVRKLSTHGLPAHVTHDPRRVLRPLRAQPHGPVGGQLAVAIGEWSSAGAPCGWFGTERLKVPYPTHLRVSEHIPPSALALWPCSVPELLAVFTTTLRTKTLRFPFIARDQGLTLARPPLPACDAWDTSIRSWALLPEFLAASFHPLAAGLLRVARIFALCVRSTECFYDELGPAHLAKLSKRVCELLSCHTARDAPLEWLASSLHEYISPFRRGRSLTLASIRKRRSVVDIDW